MAIETPIFNETEPQNSTPRVLICDVLPDDALNPLRAKGYTVDVRTGLKPDELKEIIGGYDAAVVRSATKITPEVLEQAGNLELVVRAGVGIDNVDVAAATEKGITVA